MRQSYVRNNKDISDNIKTDAFAGSSQGYGTDILKTLLATYKGYSDIPAWARYKVFGDTLLGKLAFAEDQNSLQPILDEYGNFKFLPKNKEDDSSSEASQIEGTAYTDDNGLEGPYAEEQTSYVPNRDKRSTAIDDDLKSAWESGKLASSNHESLANTGGVSNVANNGNPTQENLTKDWTKGVNAKVDGMKGQSNEDIRAWQQFLVDSGYDLGTTGDAKNGVDGNWAGKSQAAFDDWVSKNPNSGYDDWTTAGLKAKTTSYY